MNTSKMIYTSITLLLFLLLLAACEDENTGGIKVVTTPSPATAQTVAFQTIDRDMDEDEIYGTLVITKATDESKVTEYRLYWGSSATAKLAGQVKIASFTANGSNHTHDFPENTAVPTGATHLLVYSVAGATEATTPTAYDFPDGVIELVKNIKTGLGSDPRSFIEMNGTLYFWADDDLSVGSIQVWKSDGTAEGTNRLVTSGTGGTNIASKMSVAGSYLYFIANDGSSYVKEIWKTNGSTANRVTSINDVSSSDPDFLTPMGSNLYFRATDSATNTYLWGTDGSTTNQVTNPKSSFDQMAAIGTRLYFTAGGATSGSLWSSNGSLSSIDEFEVKSSFMFSNFGNFTEFGGLLYFSAAYSANGNELWKSDGTAPNTVMVKDNTARASTPSNLIVLGSKLFYVADNDVTNYGQELWATDGSSGGTDIVKDINSGSADGFIGKLTIFNSNLFFQASDGATHGKELWKSDGTGAGTDIVKDINAGSGDSSPQCLTIFGNLLFFFAEDSSYGRELHISDGTEAGTYRLSDINSGVGFAINLDSCEMRAVGDSLVFNATNGSDGKELWRYYTK